MRAKMLLVPALAVLTVTFVPEPAHTESINATWEDAETIRIFVPGRFETTFTKGKGFGSTWFDLKHDPEKKRDLAPVSDENGFLWTKAAPEGMKGASWYACPAHDLKLLEASPTRVRVRTSGPHSRYGKTDPDAGWEDLVFEQTFTFYPSGDVYIDYALVTEKPLLLHHFLLIIKSTGAWGKNGQGEGKDEVRCSGEAGLEKPSRYNNTKSAFSLQWSDGPTHFQDILMVMYRGKYNGSYWNEGYQDKDFRAGLDILSRWPDKTIPQGKDHIRVLMRFDDDINEAKAASLYANDYRSPDRLAVSEGELDKADEGDRDADGFNEEEGCYVLNSSTDGVVFTLHGAEISRTEPAFKVKGWIGTAPKEISIDGRKLVSREDFNAWVDSDVLIIQILETVRGDVEIAITQD